MTAKAVTGGNFVPARRAPQLTQKGTVQSATSSALSNTDAAGRAKGQRIYSWSRLWANQKPPMAKNRNKIKAAQSGVVLLVETGAGARGSSGRLSPVLEGSVLF